MPRPALPAACASFCLVAGLLSSGCQVAPLPEGYSWDFKPANDRAYAPTRTGNGNRGGNAAARVSRNDVSTSGGGKAYSFASALPGRSTEAAAAGSAPGRPDLSPPAAAPRDLFAADPDASARDRDPAAALFGSPAAAPGYEVVLAPTPVTGRDPGVATYTIRRGDNLWSIAERSYGNGLRYVDIVKANPGINPDRLKLGDRLILPGVAPAR